MSKRHPYTQLTLKLYRDSGWQCDKVEYWQAFPWKKPGAGGPPGVRKDLGGIIDIIAITDNVTVGIQSTSAAGRSAHIKKILESEYAAKWCRGRLLTLVTWKKIKNRWTPRFDHFNPSDFPAQAESQSLREASLTLPEGASRERSEPQPKAPRRQFALVPGPEDRRGSS